MTESWDGLQKAFEAKFKTRSPFTEKLTALRKYPAFQGRKDFVRAVYGLWKSYIFEEEVLNYPDPTRVVLSAIEAKPLSDADASEIESLWVS